MENQTCAATKCSPGAKRRKKNFWSVPASCCYIGLAPHPSVPAHRAPCCTRCPPAERNQNPWALVPDPLCRTETHSKTHTKTSAHVFKKDDQHVASLPLVIWSPKVERYRSQRLSSTFLRTKGHLTLDQIIGELCGSLISVHLDRVGSNKERVEKHDLRLTATLASGACRQMRVAMEHLLVSKRTLNLDPMSSSTLASGAGYALASRHMLVVDHQKSILGLCRYAAGYCKQSPLNESRAVTFALPLNPLAKCLSISTSAPSDSAWGQNQVWIHLSSAVSRLSERLRRTSHALVASRSASACFPPSSESGPGLCGAGTLPAVPPPPPTGLRAG